MGNRNSQHAQAFDMAATGAHEFGVLAGAVAVAILKPLPQAVQHDAAAHLEAGGRLQLRVSLGDPLAVELWAIGDAGQELRLSEVRTLTS